MFLPDGQRKEYTTDEYVHGFVEMPVNDLPFVENDSVPIQMSTPTGIQLRMEEEPDWDSIGKQERWDLMADKNSNLKILTT